MGRIAFVVPRKGRMRPIIARLSRAIFGREFDAIGRQSHGAGRNARNRAPCIACRFAFSFQRKPGRFPEREGDMGRLSHGAPLPLLPANHRLIHSPDQRLRICPRCNCPDQRQGHSRANAARVRQNHCGACRSRQSDKARPREFPLPVPLSGHNSRMDLADSLVPGFRQSLALPRARLLPIRDSASAPKDSPLI